MTEKIQQLFYFAGARGVGKTRLAATFLPPSKIGEVLYMDSERSANNIRRQLLERGRGDFGGYIDLEDAETRFGFPKDNDLLDRIDRGETPWMDSKERDAMLEYYRYIIHSLGEVPRGKYSTFVLDVADKLEYGMRAWADKNYSRLGFSKDWGKMEVGLFRPMYEAILNAIWERGFETIIFCSHLKNVWDQVARKPVPNKIKMGGSIVLYYRSSLMIWLVSNLANPNGEPAGLIIKERMGLFDMNAQTDEWDQRRLLPYKIPICDWKHINQYLKEGKFDPANPKPDEVWSEDERDMVSEFYNNAQMALMLKDLEIEKQRQTVSMLEIGGFVSGEPKPFDSSGTEISKAVPHTRVEALKIWRNLGRKIPDFNKKLTELNVSDEQIVERWLEIVGG